MADYSFGRNSGATPRTGGLPTGGRALRKLPKGRRGWNHQADLEKTKKLTAMGQKKTSNNDDAMKVLRAKALASQQSTQSAIGAAQAAQGSAQMAAISVPVLGRTAMPDIQQLLSSVRGTSNGGGNGLGSGGGGGSAAVGDKRYGLTGLAGKYASQVDKAWNIRGLTTKIYKALPGSYMGAQSHHDESAYERDISYAPGGTVGTPENKHLAAMWRAIVRVYGDKGTGDLTEAILANPRAGGYFTSGGPGAPGYIRRGTAAGNSYGFHEDHLHISFDRPQFFRGARKGR